MLKRKRLTSIVLTLVMLLSVVAVFPKQALAETAYPDVPENHEFKPFISYIDDQDIIDGYEEDGSYKPDRNMTRAEAAKVLVLAAKHPVNTSVKNTGTFLDTDGHKLEPYIVVAKAEGIFDGEKIQEGETLARFRPDDNISRGETAKVVANALGIEVIQEKEKSFTDVEGDHIFKPYIDALTSQGILDGVSDDKFEPENLLTRGQMSKYLANGQTLPPVNRALADLGENPTEEDLAAIQELIDNLPDQRKQEEFQEVLEEIKGEDEEPGADPIMVSAISVEGSGVVGTTLTATPNPAGATGTYQWQGANQPADPEVEFEWENIGEATTTNTYEIGEGFNYIRVIFTPTGNYRGVQESDFIIAGKAVSLAIRGKGPATDGTTEFDYAAEYAAAGITFNPDTNVITLDEATFDAYLAANPANIEKLRNGDRLYVGLAYIAPELATELLIGYPAERIDLTKNSDSVHNGKYIRYFAFAKKVADVYEAYNDKVYELNKTATWYGGEENMLAIELEQHVIFVKELAPVVNETKNKGYATIQAAIDAADAEDEILVKAGEYTENLTIDRPITLKSVNGVEQTTIIGEHTISTNVKKVNISGITFKPSEDMSDGTVLYAKGTKDVTIGNSIFDGGQNTPSLEYKVNAIYAGDNMTIENTIIKNGFYVSINGYPKGLTVKNSTITNVKSGINVQGAGDNLVVENTDIDVVVQGKSNSTYAIRFASSNAGGLSMSISGGTLTVDQNEFDYDVEEHSAIVVRAGAGEGTYSISNATINGSVWDASGQLELTAILSGNTFPAGYGVVGNTIKLIEEGRIYN